MYVGKHHESVKDESDTVEKTPIHIPENYAGNAFREPEELPREATDAESTEKAVSFDAELPACTEKIKPCGRIFPGLDKLFSSDALLILLAFLLWGSEDSELALIVLLLLLF